MPSFDIVSKTDLAEVDNAVNGVKREMETRFDFKGSKATIEHQKGEITLVAEDEVKLTQMQDMVKAYFVRRKLDPGALDWGKEAQAGGMTLRQVIKVKQGIDQELSKKIVKAIKDSKMKVTPSIQGDELRVQGKKLDDLQAVIALVKGLKIEQPLQYVNFRD